MAAVGALKILLDNDLLEAGAMPGRPPLGDPAVATLPEGYLQTISVVNGFSVYNGIYRLFGFRTEPYLDVRAWNSADGWRFAWDDRVDQFLLIGETAFGDQYAFRQCENGQGYENSVYQLEANFLQPEVIADSFEGFLADEMLRNSTTPYDTIAIEAVERLGPVDVSKNLAYAPSIALGGPEDVASLIALDAYTAMVYAGDIALAIDRASHEAQLRGVEGWVDQLGRPRIRVNFE